MEPNDFSASDGFARRRFRDFARADQLAQRVIEAWLPGVKDLVSASAIRPKHSGLPAEFLSSPRARASLRASMMISDGRSRIKGRVERLEEAPV